MPNNHNVKQRCEQCKSVLIKGTVLSIIGETKVRCEKCQHVNVLKVEPQRIDRRNIFNHDTSIQKALSDSIEMAYAPRLAGVQ
jgi:phage FluMu protein Com